MQWLQNPKEIYENNINSVRCEINRHLNNKERDYLKDKMNELAMSGRLAENVARIGVERNSYRLLVGKQ
jgi:hypothetical protein